MHQFPKFILARKSTYSGISSAHHQEFIHCTLGTGICHTVLQTAFEQDQDVPSLSCSRQRNCPQHVYFHAKINLGKIIDLGGFFFIKEDVFNNTSPRLPLPVTVTHMLIQYRLPNLSKVPLTGKNIQSHSPINCHSTSAVTVTLEDRCVTQKSFRKNDTCSQF